MKHIEIPAQCDCRAVLEALIKGNEAAQEILKRYPEDTTLRYVRSDHQFIAELIKIWTYEKDFLKAFNQPF